MGNDIQEYIDSLMDAGVILKEDEWREWINKEKQDYKCDISVEMEYIIDVLKINGFVWLGVDYDDE